MCMVEDVDGAFILGDFITKDPFYNIYLQKRDDRSGFFYVYTDYNQYLQYLNIIWKRIKEEYKTIGLYHRKSFELLANQKGDNPSNQDAIGNVDTQILNMLSVLECDIEAFILFARRFLDKVAKLIESLIIIKKGTQVGNSFSAHRKFFIINKGYNPSYSNLLSEETN
jgi:hypothetical protein